jgi:hypothetical protein
MLYMQQRCVANKTFKYPTSEAVALVKAFGKKVYGDKKIIVQVFDDKLAPKLKNKLGFWLVKLLLKLGLI